MTISTEHVRRLLDADDAAAVLVLIEGRTEVVTESTLHTEAYNGAMRIITRDELIKRAGGADLSDRELAEQAATLDAAVSELGG